MKKSVNYASLSIVLLIGIGALLRLQLRLKRQPSAAAKKAGLAADPTGVQVLPFEVGRPLRGSVTIVNNGETAARDLYIRSSLELLPAALPTRFNCIEREDVTCPKNLQRIAHFSPGDVLPLSLERNYLDGRPENISAAEKSAWLDGKVYVVEFGFISYYDSLGTYHWKKFCFTKTAQGLTRTDFNTQSCKTYNRADQNHDQNQ